MYNELPVQYCVYDRLLNHSRPSGILSSTCQKYWSLQYFGATLHIRHTASNHRTSLVMSAKRSNCSSVARGSKKACLPNRSASQCKGNPINLASRNERRFPRKSQTDYKGSLKSANDSKPTPLVQIRLLLFWRLLLQDISSTLTPLKIETALSFIRETKSICQSM